MVSVDHFFPVGGDHHSGQVGASIGILIRQCRIAADLTQGQLADAAKVSIAAVRDLEQGRTLHPRWATVESLASVLGIGPRQRAELMRTRPVPTGTADAGIAHGAHHAHDIRIDVLGPLTATRFGLLVRLGSVRQRAVLGLLVLHRGTWLNMDAIIDALWGSKSPASTAAEVRGYVSRLRRSLDPMRSPGGRDGLIASSGRGYQVMADKADIDLIAFEQWARRADEAVARAEPARACEHYERALALWRGDALADIDLVRQHPAVTELDRRRAELVIDYAKAAAQAGVHARALPHLRLLCAREPFNEQAHAHLMLALAAIGEQAAALAAFTDLRRRLDSDLGIRPGPAVAQAHVQILRQQLTGVSSP